MLRHSGSPYSPALRISWSNGWKLDDGNGRRIGPQRKVVAGRVGKARIADDRALVLPHGLPLSQRLAGKGQLGALDASV
jgi:hypothetical protein